MSIRLKGVDMPSKANDFEHFQDSGTWHLATNPKLYEPQRSNHFEFIVNLKDIVKAGMMGTETNGTFAGTEAQEVIRLSTTQAAVPHFTQNVIEIKRGNTTMKFAGAITFGEGSFAVNDYIGADTKAVLMAWQNLSGNVKTEKVGLASDYKKQAYLVEYTPDFQTVRRWVLDGCWISGISEDGYNSDTADKRIITATIQYDRAYIDVDD
jgi:hypothetical protein